MNADNSSSYPQDVHTKNFSKFSVQATPIQFATSWRRLIPLGVAGLGIALIVGGVLFEYINSTHKTSLNTNGKIAENAKESSAGVVAGVNNLVKEKMIKVDVSGAVMQPGVVETPANSRIQDVLISAGGLSPNADRKYVSKNINLAQRVNDGAKIYIPAVGETNSSNGGISTNTESGLININSATESQLDSLPGVGPVTAGKIIAGRPYQDVSELLSKKIVGASVFEKIKDKVSVY